VYARQIPEAAVTSLKNTGAAHRRLNRYQYVVTVYGDCSARKILRHDAAPVSRGKLLIGAGAAHNSQSLSLRK